MRSALSAIFAFLIGASALLLAPGSIAYANFHCIRIHAVMSSFSGNNKVQYVELRMITGGQGVLMNHTIQFYDGTNTLVATFKFPANVANGLTGDSILIATSDFNALATDQAADFLFAGNTTGSAPDLNHPIPQTNGKVVFQPSPPFNCGNSVNEVDSVAYGTAIPNFGSSAAALPTDSRALVLDTTTPPGGVLVYPATDASMKNHLDPVSAVAPFAVATGNLATDLATPRNNARRVLKLTAPVSVGGVAEAPDVRGASANVASPASHSRDWMPYGIAGGIAAAMLALGAAAFAYRRRTV